MPGPLCRTTINHFVNPAFSGSALVAAHNRPAESLWRSSLLPRAHTPRIASMGSRPVKEKPSLFFPPRIRKFAIAYGGGFISARTADPLTAGPPVPAHPHLGVRVAYRLQRALNPNPACRWLSGAHRGVRPGPRGVHRCGAGGQAGPVRLPDVRPVRAARHRVRLPDGLPQGTAERPVRGSGRGRLLRGVPGPALRLGRRLRASRQRRAGPPTCACCTAQPITGAGAQSSWLNYWQGRDERAVDR